METSEQSSQPFPAQNRSVPWNRLLWFGDESVADPLVRPLLVIVVDVFVNYVADMAFAKKNHLVQTFTLYGPDEGFRISVEIRTLLGHFKTSHAHATKRTLKLLGEERIAVMYEHSFALEESVISVSKVAGLLEHPLLVRGVIDARDFDPTAG